MEFFNLEFPKIIQGVCLCLKNKNIDVRENSRKALIEILKIMGPYFLQFIINEMQFILRESNNFFIQLFIYFVAAERHIMNYTINTLLVSLISK